MLGFRTLVYRNFIPKKVSKYLVASVSVRNRGKREILEVSLGHFENSANALIKTCHLSRFYRATWPISVAAQCPVIRIKFAGILQLLPVY